MVPCRSGSVGKTEIRSTIKKPAPEANGAGLELMVTFQTIAVFCAGANKYKASSNE